MSYILFLLSSLIVLALSVKFNGTVPPNEALYILAILSAAEAIGLMCRK